MVEALHECSTQQALAALVGKAETTGSITWLIGFLIDVVGASVRLTSWHGLAIIVRVHVEACECRENVMEIRGDWETKQVWIGGREVRPERSLCVRNHSPDGFSWGDGRSGSAQLALALLLEITTEEMALLWYQDVQSYILAQLAQDDFVIDSQEVVDFIVNEVKAEFMLEARSPGGEPALEEGETQLATQAVTVEVEYRYTREDLKAIFDLVYEEDVERGGQYDGRSGAIHVYTHPWDHETMTLESTLMGTFSVAWGQGNLIWQIDAEAGFSIEALLKELGTLEEKAIGRKIHGR